MWLGKLSALDMTPLNWLGRKTVTQRTQTKQWAPTRPHSEQWATTLGQSVVKASVGWVRLNTFYDWYKIQIFTLGSNAVKIQNDCSAHIAVWRSSLIKVYTVCHSTKYFKKELHRKQNIDQKRMEKSVRNFRIFTVKFNQCDETRMMVMAVTSDIGSQS